LTTPLISRGNKKYGYFDVYLKTESLINQSTNIHLLGFDTENKMIFQDIVYPTGITGTTDWIEMPAIVEIPQTVDRFVFAISVYRNGSQPAKTNGIIYVKDPSFSPE
jgi:hypothetical protein